MIHSLQVELSRLEGASTAYRQQLQADQLGVFSELVADLIAASKNITTVGSDQAWGDWHARGKKLREKMRTQRHRMMILTGELNYPLQLIGDMPAYAAAYVNKHPTRGRHVHSPDALKRDFELANDLRDRIFDAVRAIAIEGRPFSEEESAQLRNATRALEEHWTATHKSPPGWRVPA